MDSNNAVATVTPLPKKPIMIICAILFCEAFVSSMIFPFVNFMVEDFKIAKSEEELGYYSGYLASSFFLGQFASSFIWGFLSDKYGRRPILLIGVFGSMISTTLFGFSPTYYWAIIIRSFGGLVNSNFAIARSYIGDITDATNRVKGFSFVGLMWGAGAIVGPSTGGLLSKPSDHINLSPNSVLVQYPYMLPSIVSGFISLVSWLVALIFLKESNKAVLPHLESPPGESELKEFSVSDGADELREISVSESESKDFGATESLLEGNGEGGEQYITPEFNDKTEVDVKTVPNENLLWRTLHSLGIGKQRNKYANLVDGEKQQPTSPVTLKSKVTLETVGFIFKDRSVIVSIVLLSFAGMCVITVDEIFPLWAKYPPPIGLGFDPATIGLSWAIGGITLVLFQGLIYPQLTQKVGLLTMIRYGSIGFAVVYLAFPMLSKLTSTKILLWFALGLVLFGRYVTGASVGTSLNILVNSVGGENVRKHRGAVNGIAMSVSGLARALAPVFGSSMFAWSNTNGLAFPFNHYFVFEVMSIVLLVMFVLSFLISKSAINK